MTNAKNQDETVTVTQDVGFTQVPESSEAT